MIILRFCKDMIIDANMASILVLWLTVRLIEEMNNTIIKSDCEMKCETFQFKL